MFLLLLLLALALANIVASLNSRSLLKVGRLPSRLFNLANDASFLYDRRDDVYESKILSLAIENCKKCLEAENSLIEIEFPPSRKSDISVSETLAQNRVFVRQFVKSWSTLGKSLWVLFPDNKEANLAKSDPNWGSNEKLPFTVTSLESVVKMKESEMDSSLLPKLIISVNPGFNVEEWIQLSKIKFNAPTIVVNGNLDRLRNGYYPWFFYPELTSVSKTYYSKASQALFLSPIAVRGDRFAAWLTKVYVAPWQVLLRDKTTTGSCDVILSSDMSPDATKIWNIAKTEYISRNGGGWF